MIDGQSWKSSRSSELPMCSTGSSGVARKITNHTPSASRSGAPKSTLAHAGAHLAEEEQARAPRRAREPEPDDDARRSRKGPACAARAQQGHSRHATA